MVGLGKGRKPPSGAIANPAEVTPTLPNVLTWLYQCAQQCGATMVVDPAPFDGDDRMIVEFPERGIVFTTSFSNRRNPGSAQWFELKASKRRVERMLLWSDAAALIQARLLP